MSWLKAKKKKQANIAIENECDASPPIVAVQKPHQVKSTDIEISSDIVSAIALAIFMDGMPSEIVAIIALAIFISSEEGAQKPNHPIVASTIPSIGWVLQGRIQLMQDRMFHPKF